MCNSTTKREWPHGRHSICYHYTQTQSVINSLFSDQFHGLVFASTCHGAQKTWWNLIIWVCLELWYEGRADRTWRVRFSDTQHWFPGAMFVATAPWHRQLPLCPKMPTEDSLLNNHYPPPDITSTLLWCHTSIWHMTIHS